MPLERLFESFEKSPQFREVATNPKLGGLRGYPPKSGGATGKIVGLTAKKVGGLKPPPVATSLN